MERVIIAGHHDDEVVVRLNEILALLRRPEALMAPAFVIRVLRTARRGTVSSSGTAAARTSDRSAITTTADRPV